jgi:hypothetical protein
MELLNAIINPEKINKSHQTKFENSPKIVFIQSNVNLCKPEFSQQSLFSFLTPHYQI